MRILCVCVQGENRSRRLANFLAAQGHETDFAGAGPLSLNRVAQQRIDWAQAVVALTPGIRSALERSFDLSGKRVIALDVRDPDGDVEGQMQSHLPL